MMTPTTASPATGGHLDDFLGTARIPLHGTEQGVRFEDWRPEPDAAALEAARAYVATWPPERPFLVLQSKNRGNGKTMLACAIMREAWDRYGPAARGRFCPVAALLDEIRSTFDPESPVRTAALQDSLYRYPLLVLDDLGTQQNTDWAIERLFMIIDRRYCDRRPMIITSNMTMGHIDERIRDRLLDTRLSTVVTFTAPSHRTGASIR